MPASSKFPDFSKFILKNFNQCIHIAENFLKEIFLKSKNLYFTWHLTIDLRVR